MNRTGEAREGEKESSWFFSRGLANSKYSWPGRGRGRGGVGGRGGGRSGGQRVGAAPAADSAAL